MQFEYQFNLLTCELLTIQYFLINIYRTMVVALVLTHDQLLSMYDSRESFREFISEYCVKYASKIRNIKNARNTLKYDKSDIVTYNNDYYCIVCIDNAKFIGITFAIRNDTNAKIFKTLPRTYIGYWYIYGTYVNEAYRGRGVNNLMFQKLCETTNSAKFLTMIANDNMASIKSYQKLGFKAIKNKTPYANTLWFSC